ncbi:class I adenylate-forming enzyme family protein [uncultured Phenylobacterium sp.]|uniref:class I adenylate-forming enzyme family protein n=1 Tax=uncultured Phenylobacterium sp. TaxID=349273 RepID=UPI0025DF4082|nr:class I adenylate-forming enzyme family protein [uncultured Phenylobacterium sp.]
MFDAYIRDHASWNPRAPAVLLPRREVSYAELDADVDRLGGWLAAQGLTPGVGAVSVAVADAYEQYVATAALSRLAIASAPAADDGADLRLVDHPPAEPGGPPRLEISRDWRAAEPRRLPALLPDPDALGRVMLSSGTTRTARRVALSWRRLDLGNYATLHQYCAGKLGAWTPLTGIDSMMGWALVTGAWSVGACAVNGWSMDDIPRRLESLPSGVIGLTPTLLRTLLAALPPGFRPQPGWRIVCGGALLPLAVAREARLRLTPDIRLIYGATEIGTIALGFAAGLEDAPDQIGIVPSGITVEFIGDDGRPVPDGEAGEIRVRGPRIVPGYIGDPQATAERFRDGWFHTGDLGRRLADGRVALAGRVDDRMIVDGMKFMPSVLEDAAMACPGVRDAAAFAVPDIAGLDQCWLAVSAEPGFDRDSLAPHLARYPGLPAYRFAWIGEIPRNAMGKVERTKLRAAVLAVTGQGQ